MPEVEAATGPGRGDRGRARIEFGIPAVPPSMNVLMRSRGRRITAPREWKLLVRSFGPHRSSPRWWVAESNEPKIVTLTFVGAQGDADNYCKLVLDGIVAAGLLKDDRYPYLSELRLRVRPGKPRRTVVRIELA